MSQFERGKWGGERITRGPLYYILRNRTYLGEILHKGQVHTGLHKAIVDRALWDRAQEILAGNARARSDGKDFADPSPLAGILFDGCGNRLTPSHTQRCSIRYRYYICQALLQDETAKVGLIKRVPANEIEEAVAQQLCGLLTNPARLIEYLFGETASGDLKQAVATAANTLAADCGQGGQKRWLSLARAVISKIVAGPETLQITFDRAELCDALGLVRSQTEAANDVFTITVSVRLTRSGRQKRMIIADDQGTQQLMNDGMVLAVARAIKWDQEIRDGASVTQIAKRQN